ncbi:MAG: DUF4097 family beta strand repeat protein [Clostridia bacterium]|nr:DUF4097 family beta strand repeat protein [Clostridia bacterium]
MEKRLKKATIVVAIVVGVLVLLAVLLGVLNALVGGGAWQIGWKDYRYDESGYEIGEGSIVADSITGIDLDWIDGEVNIVSCRDTFASISERADGDLPESAKVRWRVLEDGTLQIKYRKSSWFFGIGSSNRNKKLTLRIPEKFLEAMNSVHVEATSADVNVVDLRAKDFVCESVSGAITVKNCSFDRFSTETTGGSLSAEGLIAREISVESMGGDVELTLPVLPDEIDAESMGGDIVLRMPKDSSFSMDWETNSGQLAYDLPLSKSGDRYLCGNGTKHIDVETASGDLTLVALN